LDRPANGHILPYAVPTEHTQHNTDCNSLRYIFLKSNRFSIRNWTHNHFSQWHGYRIHYRNVLVIVNTNTLLIFHKK